MDRRVDIITGVWRVILARGISGVSIRAVAETAGVSIGLVQHYYRSKDMLIHASAEAMIAGAASRYRTHVAPGDAVRHLVTHSIPTTEAARDGVVIWHAYLAASVGDDILARLLREAKSGQEHELALMLQSSMPSATALRTARAVIALADGLSARVITGDLTGDEAMAAALGALEQRVGTPA